MKNILVLILAFSFGLGCAQSSVTYQGEKINELDAEGRKTGLWKLYDHERGLVISVEMDKDRYVSPIEYVQYGKVIALKEENQVRIYKDGKEIKGEYRLVDGKSMFFDEQGNNLDDETRKIYSSVAETRPLFYGGTTAMLDFIRLNIDKNKIKGHKGKVIVKFVVDNDGNVTDVAVSETTDPFLNDEAVRLVKKLPRHQPGFQGGKFVRVQYSLPLNF